jgi:hypothetical protein
MSFKLVVKPTVNNKSVFRKRGLFHTDNEMLKDLAKEIAKTKTFTCYFHDEQEYEYFAKLVESLGLKRYEK